MYSSKDVSSKSSSVEWNLKDIILANGKKSVEVLLSGYEFDISEFANYNLSTIKTILIITTIAMPFVEFELTLTASPVSSGY
jgi:hypothetical protein